MKHKHIRCWISGIVLLLVVLAGCQRAAETPERQATMTTQDNDSQVKTQLAPASALVPELRQLPERAQIAYRFALANQETLTKIPCYCGCAGVGHMDNRMCYIRSDIGDEQIVFDNHASL
jgi:hypothetical protein